MENKSVVSVCASYYWYSMCLCKWNISGCSIYTIEIEKKCNDSTVAIENSVNIMTITV